MCDGIGQCPHRDDELLCDFSCPETCFCQGLAFVCASPFNVTAYPSIRFLDGSYTSIRPMDLSSSLKLIYLKLSHCEIHSLDIPALLNLQTLDLSMNLLNSIDLDLFLPLINLMSLYLKGNPITMIYSSPSINNKQFQELNLKMLDLSVTLLTAYDNDIFRVFPNLQKLNISNTRIDTIRSFNSTLNLEILDVSDSPLKSFPANLLKNLTKLKFVISRNFKQCCEKLLPANFDRRNCHADFHALDSCEDLL